VSKLQKWRREFTGAQRDTLRHIEEEVSTETAARLMAAIRRAYKEAHEEAAKDDDPNIAKQTFSRVLPVFITRYLRSILWPRGTSVRVRPAHNATRTNVFLYLMLGRLRLTPAKTRTVNASPGVTVYRRTIQQGGVTELISPPEFVRSCAEDIIGVLQHGHTFEFGIPAEPEFVRISVFENEGRKYGAYIDLMDRAQGKMARVLEEMVIEPLIKPILLPVAGEPSLTRVSRRRGEPATQQGDEEKKPS
jgi:hypothetical protein